MTLHLCIDRIPDEAYVLLQNTTTGELHAGHDHPYCGLSLVDVTPEQAGAARSLQALISHAGQQYDGGSLLAYAEPEYQRVQLSAFQPKATP